MSQLVSIVYKPEDAPRVEGAYTRIPLQETRLIAGHGIQGDLKGGGDRQLNIMAVESVASLQGDGFLAKPGQLGEQLIVAGLKIDALPVGARLRIGEEAEVEVVEPRTGCGRFEAYQGRTKEEANGRMGIMARVTTSGLIRVADTVCVLP